jgi:amino acid adenylation domain-containing protein
MMRTEPAAEPEARERADMTTLLHHAVDRQAARRGDALAVACEGERMTYAQLADESARLAGVLRRAGCRRGDRVGLLLDKSPRAIVAIVAILRAGCAYVPLDPGSPPPRLARIVVSSEPRAIVAATTSGTGISDLAEEGALGPRVAIAWLGEDPAPDLAPRPVLTLADLDAAEPVLDSGGSLGDAAYIMFTSGSTGMPKGVVITHANVRVFVDWAVEHFGLTEEDRVSGHAPLHFDLSTLDIHGALAVGAQLHLVPSTAKLDPRAVARLIREAELTQWFSVPSVLAYMARFGAVEDDDFPTLRRVMWCGEVLPTPVLRHWMLRLPHVTFTNLYGPTEATVASSWHEVAEVPAEDDPPVPIGVPCGGEDLLVLDERLEPAADGESGDLYIAGAGLSPGYWRDEAKTQAAFIAAPAALGGRLYRTGDIARRDEDGVVHFLGRADAQIKSRGHRIELGEIETALHTFEELAECAVVAVDSSGFDGKAICCAYVAAASSGSEVTPAVLRERLGRLVPSYMLPARWLALDAMPKNQNGKIDRPALRERFDRDRSRVAAGAPGARKAS